MPVSENDDWAALMTQQPVSEDDDWATLMKKQPPKAEGTSPSVEGGTRMTTEDHVVKMRVLEERMDELNRVVEENHYTTGEIDSLKKVVESLQGPRPSFGGLEASTEAEIGVWIQKFLTNMNFGLFMDAVSFFYFLKDDHRNADDVANTIDKAHRAGKLSGMELRIITSMQNGEPKVLAGGGDTASKPLPKLPTVKKWDTGGRFGLKHTLLNAVPNVNKLLGKAINKLESAEARSVANAFVSHTLLFIKGLCTFISGKYDQLSVQSGYSPEEAWLVVATMFKRIFSDLAEARVEARDVGGGTGDSKLETATACIWSTFKTHQVMAEYLHYNFKDHPNMASELVNHLMLHVSHKEGVGMDHTLDLKFHKMLLKRFEAALRESNSRVEALDGKVSKRKGQKARYLLDDQSEDEEEDEA
jgi:hypothetical protein